VLTFDSAHDVCAGLVPGCGVAGDPCPAATLRSGVLAGNSGTQPLPQPQSARKNRHDTSASAHSAAVNGRLQGTTSIVFRPAAASAMGLAEQASAHRDDTSMCDDPSPPRAARRAAL
jgi:hypothetical protein